MKTSIAIISLSAILVCLAASAQTQPRAAAGGLAERFKQWDRNGDGVLAEGEISDIPWLKNNLARADTNGDGVVTLEEVTGSFGSSAQAPAAVAHPDFSGNWALDAEASTGPAQMLSFEAKAKYRITQDGKLLSFYRSDSNLTVNYPLNGTEGSAEFRSAASRKASVSGRWLPDGKTLELKTVFQPHDDSPSAFRITEQMVLSPDKGTITLRRSTTGGRQIQDPTLVYRRVESDVPPAQPSVTRDAASSETVVSSLTKPSLEICLSAGSAEEATKFFAEGIGLVARGEPRSGASGAALRMLLFSAGSSTVKVRVYQQPPAKLPAEIAARNGLRVLTIPVERLDDTVARLKRLRFEVTHAKLTGDVRWALARNADGTAFELVETQPGTARELEIGLVVPDLAKAREFFTGVYGAQELPETTSRVLPGDEELRFTTGGTVFKCWAPKGQRESDTQKIPELLGFRYVTHSVRDTHAVHDTLTAKGVELASPLSSHQGVASLFMVRGPGGVLLEFVGPAAAGGGGAGVATLPEAARIPQQMQDLFNRMDRDGDGKLSPREIPNAERFKQMDANGDGFVTLEEAVKLFGGGAASARRGSPDPAETSDRQVSTESGRPAVGPVARSGDRPQRRVTGKEPDLHPPTDRAFLDFQFTTDFFAASQPPDSALAKVTEANALMPHNGMLFCATSYMPPSDGPSRGLANVNPKVLVKKSATAPWEVDLEAGREFMRLSIIKSVAFTTDGTGNKLPKPVSVLVCGTGAWRSQPTGVYVFSRNDATGQWTKTLLTANRWNREKTNHTTDVRTIWDHVDTVTGVHFVFAGSASGRIFRGVYDPSQPGLIAWDLKPELDDMVGHFLCAAEANEVQYVGVAYGPTKEDVRQIRERPLKDHGLFRRVDGPNAHWEWIPIKEWEDPNQPGRSLRTAQLRGMTAVPAPDGKGEVLLVAWDTRDAVIERIDPRHNFKKTVELDVRNYFATQWSRPVGVSTFAYNDMLPVTHPVTGEKAHLIGLWLVDPNGESNEIGKSSWYLVRYADGTYRYGRIWDEKNPLTNSPYGLRGCRSIRSSPFAEEAGRVWYFCGFDQTGARGAGATGPAGWIYRGTLPSRNEDER